ncbi:calmodulin binding protein PICBP [Coffea eugenioides]|uniref:calmodulin binding protein PICBP n=1 Tax=Coffea eugenioides TaxID=49369 RepID=UPI000F6141A4|nr:calmodulin binding protein PICBP [Coffea eugenioides]
MAAEPTFSQNLDSRNRGGTEPKRKLWRKRSIRLARRSYLRQSSKSSRSQFEWLPVDESRGTSSRRQPSLVALSDSSPNYVKEGSEYDDVNSVVSSSCGCGWSDRVAYPSITMSDDAAVPRHQCSSEVSDASPLSLKATRYQASHHDSESSYDSSEHSKSSHYTPLKTNSSGQKSLQTLTRSSSKKAVKVLFKKSSFKPKRTPLKHSHILEDSSVERATCSSTIKDSRFPEHVELEPGQTESERISFVKVCPYHHCSLNGHCHEPEPPIPKKPFLRRKSQSSIPQRSASPSTGKKGSGEKKKGAKKQPRAQFLKGANAAVEDSNLIEIALNGTSHPEKGNQESLEKLQNSSTQEEDVPETYFELKERSSGSYQERKEEDKWNNLALGVVSEEGHETTTSKCGREPNNVTLDGDNDNFSRTSPLKYTGMPHDQVSISGDCDSDSKSSENNASCNITRNLFSSKINEETSRNQEPTRVVVSKSAPAGDSEGKEQVSTIDSEPAVSSGVHKGQIGKGRKMSMWHLIHKHVSGLDGDGGTRPLQGADEGRKIEEADKDTAKKSSDVGSDFSDSDVRTYNQDEENQDIEIRKLYAVKLVREAIEKILLPEVQDQLSENQSVTSDIVEDQELSERNQQGPDEGCHSRNHTDSENIPADRVPQDQVDDSTSQQEIKKSEANSGKKSDKKSPSNWSNLKKWILLQRFTKELEKVRKLNLRKPWQLQLETDSGAEKISLRRQTADDKKRTEEWMLDYALQQVVSQLAPTQKRKVSLLVKAFETVVPPQEERTVQARDDATSRRDGSGNSSDHVEHFETNNHQLPAVDAADISTDTYLKSDNLKSSSSNDAPLNESQRVINVEEFSSLKSEDFAGGFEFKIKNEKKDDLSGLAGERSHSIQSETCDVGRKPIATENILPASDEDTADSFRAPELENSTNTEPENVDSRGLHNYTTIRPNSLVVSKFPPLDSACNYTENEAGQSQLDKQNYLSMWHSVCQHVVSSVANKVGIELLGEEDEEAEDASKVSGIETPASRKGTPKGIHGMANEIDVASYHRAEFSRSQVLKLVKEAIQEILSPEIQDDSSDTHSVSSEIIPDKELSDKDSSEGAKQSSTGLTEQNAREIDRSEEGISLDGGKGSNNNANTEEDCRIAVSLEKSKSDPPKAKNWSKLKKLILLKRSIKAMEKARNLKLKPPQQLPLPSDVEPEKVDLRHQMIDERRKAEQWMLDYAVQHIVTKLTPARKKRVAMLVEAFEAVVPLPDT